MVKSFESVTGKEDYRRILKCLQPRGNEGDQQCIYTVCITLLKLSLNLGSTVEKIILIQFELDR